MAGFEEPLSPKLFPIEWFLLSERSFHETAKELRELLVYAEEKNREAAIV